MGSAKTNWLLRAHFQGLRLIDDVAADDSRDVRPAALVPWIERRHKRQLNVKAKAMGVADCPVPGISGVRPAPAIGILNAESSRPSGHFSGALWFTKLRAHDRAPLMRIGNTAGRLLSQ